MRTFAESVGRIMIWLGVVEALLGASLAAFTRAGPVVLKVGIATFVVGIVLSRLSPRKACPVCDDRVNQPAIRRRCCVHEFGGALPSLERFHCRHPGSRTGRLF
jgi:hypothetical protein